MRSILVFNGSPSGPQGNCQKLIQKIQTYLPDDIKVRVVHLKQTKSMKTVLKAMTQAQGFIFVTGTYWDSWGSPLQKFLEDITDYEGSEILMGKPACVFVLKHSVGGKGVLSRLQGVLSTMGLLIPPMSGMVYSLSTEMALQIKKNAHADDFWSLRDLQVILKNFDLAMNLETPWRSWGVDRKNFRKTWIK